MSDASERPSQSLPAGERVTFEIGSGNGHLILTLGDGAVLALHPIVLDVMRLGATNEQGEPMYNVVAGLAVRLMKKPDEGKGETT